MHRGVRASLVALATLVVTGAQARAEEGGSGHYTPGANASFIDALPGRPGLALADFFLYYPASAGVQLPIGGQLAANLDATVFADTLVAVYQTPLGFVGGGYAFGGGLPGVWVDFGGTGTGLGGHRSAGGRAHGHRGNPAFPFVL